MIREVPANPFCSDGYCFFFRLIFVWAYIKYLTEYLGNQVISQNEFNSFPNLIIVESDDFFSTIFFVMLSMPPNMVEYCLFVVSLFS